MMPDHSVNEWLKAILADSFTWLLAGGFLLFWINMGCTYRLLYTMSRKGFGKNLWLLAGVVSGPLALGLHRIVRRIHPDWIGEGPGDSRRGDESGVTQLPDMALLTRDGQRIETRLGSKSDSGLEDTLRLLRDAIDLHASDMHFDTVEEGVRYAIRIDGKLRPSELLPEEAGRRVMSVLKTAAGVDYANREETRDGACTFICGSRSYDLRIARAWAVNGETIVVRALEAQAEDMTLEELGVPAELAPELRALMVEPSGLIVVAGPTGSGKTTTLYAMLRSTQGDGRAILTIEDPVEYRIPEATQISINPKVAATFASALRASMRHDCDIILVGEVRDQETLEVAFQASLTGHLVLTTFHAASITAALARLQQLGLSSFMIGAGLRAVICQRLVRKLCTECREPFLPSPAEREKLPFGSDLGPDTVLFRPKGCEFCGDSGFRGRTAVIHFVILSRETRDRLNRGEEMSTVLPDIIGQSRGGIGHYIKSLLATGVTDSDELARTLTMFGEAHE